MNEQLQNIEGERPIPDVNSVTNTRWQRGAIVVVMAFVTVASAGAAYMKYIAPVEADETIEKDVAMVSTVVPRIFEAEPEIVPVAVVKSILPAPILPAPILPIPVIKPAPAMQKPIPEPPTFDKSASGSSVVNNRAMAIQPVTSQPAAPSTPSSQSSMSGLLAGNSGAQGDTGSLSGSLRPTKLTATKASTLTDRNFLIPVGSFIDCALSTRLDSTVPGMTSCVVTRDVFSENGNVVLVERGSLVTGEYRSNLKQGSNRIFVLWNRIKTTEGVVIDVNSPATDSLGGSGISGQVESHFWRRFGGALLLSLVDDVARAATTSASNNDNTQILVNSAGEVTSDLATEVLRHTINIPPTLYTNQGARVGIFVARDMDFSTVYDTVAQ